MQHQKSIITDPTTGVVTLEFMFPAGDPLENVRKAVNPAGPRPGFELRTRWETKDDGAVVLRIGEVSKSDVPPPVDDLDGKSIGQLVSLGVREGLNGKGGKVALNTQMHAEDVKRLIRENRKPKMEPVGAGA